jgi:hypothetical protein
MATLLRCKRYFLTPMHKIDIFCTSFSPSRLPSEKIPLPKLPLFCQQYNDLNYESSFPTRIVSLLERSPAFWGCGGVVGVGFGFFQKVEGQEKDANLLVETSFGYLS